MEVGPGHHLVGRRRQVLLLGACLDVIELAAEDHVDKALAQGGGVINYNKDLGAVNNYNSNDD